MVSFKSPFPPAEPPREGERGRESGPPGRPTRRRSPGGPVRPFPRAGVFPSCPPPFPRPAVSHSSYPALWWAGSGAPSADAANGGAFGRRKTNGDGDGGGGKGDWAGLRLEARRRRRRTGRREPRFGGRRVSQENTSGHRCPPAPANRQGN